MMRPDQIPRTRRPQRGTPLLCLAMVTALVTALPACSRQQQPAGPGQAVQTVAVQEPAVEASQAVPPLAVAVTALEAAPAAGTLPNSLPTALPPGHPPVGAAAGPVEVPASLTPADLTMADLERQAKSLDGQLRTVRGVVVKVNHGILDRNWIHIQDQTGKVVATSAADVVRGAIVRAQGRVAADQDVGAGYRYSVLLRDATVIVETPPTVAK